MKSVIDGRQSLFDIGDMVTTRSGLTGEIIGIAEYQWGFEYRIVIPNRQKTLYRKEAQLVKAEGVKQ